MSKVYSFTKVQKLPVDMEQAWNYFSDPGNLQALTPGDLDFKILSKNHVMYPGQILQYIVRPLLSVPVYWMTEITHVSEKKYFVDEQRYGPYSFWHHQHHFKEISEGVEMTDIVHYKLPLWFIGDIINTVLVRKKLKEIFDYRYKVVEGKFNLTP
ncbi:MAG: SRPBCC family protein [Ferruginibacter sp.]